jgi:glycosyltransferase involved in cell wall biosynthesis
MKAGSREIKPSVLLVLPVYHEAAVAGAVCRTLRPYLATNRNLRVIVVDDGSTDGTAEAFRRGLRGLKRATVMGLHENGGKGRAVRLAFAGAKEDFLIFLDGDLAYPLSHLRPMISGLKSCDVVIGSRSMVPQAEGSLPKRRAFLGWGFNRLACLLFGFDYPDTQAGLKGFRRRAARELFLRQKVDGFAFDAELLYLARKLSLKVGQIPAQVSGTHSYKTSRVKLTVDTLICFWDFLLIRFRSWTGQYRHP